MCSGSKIKNFGVQAARLGTALGTVGLSEVARKNLSTGNFINKIFQYPERITNQSSDYINEKLYAAGWEGAKDAPPPEPIPEAPKPEPPATPQGPAPGISNLSEQRRKRRLSSLRMGILGNIRAQGGDTSSANLLTPSASAGAKTLLGQ